MGPESLVQGTGKHFLLIKEICIREKTPQSPFLSGCHEDLVSTVDAALGLGIREIYDMQSMAKPKVRKSFGYLKALLGS